MLKVFKELTKEREPYYLPQIRLSKGLISRLAESNPKARAYVDSERLKNNKYPNFLDPLENGTQLSKFRSQFTNYDFIEDPKQSQKSAIAENMIWNDDDDDSSVGSEVSAMSGTIVRDSRVFETMTSLGDIYSRRSGHSPRRSPPHSGPKPPSRSSIQDLLGSEPALGFLKIKRKMEIIVSPRRRLKKIKFHSNRSRKDMLEINIKGTSEDRPKRKDDCLGLGLDTPKPDFNFLSARSSPKSRNQIAKKTMFNSSAKHYFAPISSSHFSNNNLKTVFTVPVELRSQVLQQTSLKIEDNMMVDKVEIPEIDKGKFAL